MMFNGLPCISVVVVTTSGTGPGVRCWKYGRDKRIYRRTARGCTAREIIRKKSRPAPSDGVTERRRTATREGHFLFTGNGSWLSILPRNCAASSWLPLLWFRARAERRQPQPPVRSGCPRKRASSADNFASSQRLPPPNRRYVKSRLDVGYAPVVMRGARCMSELHSRTLPAPLAVASVPPPTGCERAERHSLFSVALNFGHISRCSFALLKP